MNQRQKQLQKGHTEEKEEETVFEKLELWNPDVTIEPPEFYVPKSDPLFLLFQNLYFKTKEIYQQLPKRKNGEIAFIHPLNIVRFLKKAKITNVATLCTGLIHDYIEESVDIYKEQNHMTEDPSGIKNLDIYEEYITTTLQQELTTFCKEHNLNPSTITPIIEATKILTRHKRDFYYASISGIFEHKNESIREIAIQVKLADRTHNILCIEGFTEEARIFQCFKNLFILNNTKKYLLEKTSQNPSTEKLFKKCAKATYCAFLTCGHLVRLKGIAEITPMLQLAFKKYALEEGGLWAVTEVHTGNTHLTRLFQGIVRKWDARLHHEWNTFNEKKQVEEQFVKEFFKSKNYTSEQITAIVDYKDAYSLKEVIAYLMYNKEYIISKFVSSDLTAKRRIE